MRHDASVRHTKNFLDFSDHQISGLRPPKLWFCPSTVRGQPDRSAFLTLKFPTPRNAQIISGSHVLLGSFRINFTNPMSHFCSVKFFMEVTHYIAMMQQYSSAQKRNSQLWSNITNCNQSVAERPLLLISKQAIAQMRIAFSITREGFECKRDQWPARIFWPTQYYTFNISFNNFFFTLFFSLCFLFKYILLFSLSFIFLFFPY